MGHVKRRRTVWDTVESASHLAWILDVHRRPDGGERVPVVRSLPDCRLPSIRCLPQAGYLLARQAQGLTHQCRRCRRQDSDKSKRRHLCCDQRRRLKRHVFTCWRRTQTKGNTGDGSAGQETHQQIRNDAPRRRHRGSLPASSGTLPIIIGAHSDHPVRKRESPVGERRIGLSPYPPPTLSLNRKVDAPNCPVTCQHPGAEKLSVDVSHAPRVS
jgi:hypothetical protein